MGLFFSKIKENKILQYAILILLFCIPFVYYDYFALLCSPPVGTHIWRQTDSASFAWCYWKNGLDFFHPQILNRSFGNGYAVSEFPILQYFIALFYAVFGFHWWISKAVYVFIYFTGLLAIYRISFYYLKNIFWAYFMSLLFFTAPAMVFYGNTCIPDVAALSLSFIGFSFYLSFRESNRNYFLWISIFFFCFAGLLKITYLMLFLSGLISELILVFKYKTIKKYFLMKYAMPVLFLLASITLWFWWSDKYNQGNEHLYFLNKTNPYWNYTSDKLQKAYIFNRTITEWALRFFAAPTNFLFLFSLLWIPFGWIKGNKRITLISFFLLSGCILYYLLWYFQFLVHDYYTIPFYAVYLFSILSMLIIITKLRPPVIMFNILKLAAVVLLVINMIHVKEDFKIRYQEADLYPADKYLLEEGLVPYIRSVGIKENDYVAAIPDGSPQIILCALQNPGFTEFLEGKYTTATLAICKQKGAKFLIIIDQLPCKELIEQLGTPIGKYKEALIYKL